MEGWLDKRYPLRWGKWPRRWCVLSRQRLCYYQCQANDKAERQNLRGWIEIQPGATVARFCDEGAPGDAKHHRSEKPFGFVLLVQGLQERFFYFSALDEQSMQSWVQAIQNLAKCSGKRLVSRRTTLRHSILGGLSAPAGGVFHGEDSRPVWEVYEQQARLGSGAFGTVFRARERDTGRVVALKHLPHCSSSVQRPVGEDAVAEFMLCARVAHPHVLRVFSFFAAPDAVYIACELAARGELLEFLTTNKDFASESGIAAVCSQVLSALVYLHGQGMVHHDVKPPNVLVTDQVCHQSQEVFANSVKPVLVTRSREDFGANFGRVAAGLTEPPRAGWEAPAQSITGTGAAASHNSAGPLAHKVPLVVLGDFGTARLCCSSSLGLHGKASGGRVLGTPEYCGPEVFKGKTGDKTDVYALGVTLFELLAGGKPFEQQFHLFASGDRALDGDDRFHQMRDVSVEADWALLRGVSEQGRNLVRRMMAKAFADRPSAAECSKDSWFSTANASDGLVLEERHARAERLLRRANLGFYAKALMNMMATQISGDLLQKERTVFRLLDVDRSGAISVEELLAAFGKMGLSQERAAMVLRSYDVDRSGTLGFNEWLGATMFLDVQDSTELMGRVRALFKQLDTDNRGAIALEDLRRYFGEQSEDNGKALEAFFCELDADGDGVVSLEEFVEFWRDVA